MNSLPSGWLTIHLKNNSQLIFPLSIKRKIVLTDAECSISSEGYIINHIDEYMEQFGMLKKRRDKNELFYLNMDPFRSLTLKRRRVIRNLLFRVEITDSNMIITLESASILQFVACLMIVVIPLVLFPLSEIYFLPIMAAALFTLYYFVKLSALNQFKEEVEKLVLALD